MNVDINTIKKMLELKDMIQVKQMLPNHVKKSDLLAQIAAMEAQRDRERAMHKKMFIAGAAIAATAAAATAAYMVLRKKEITIHLGCGIGDKKPSQAADACCCCEEEPEETVIKVAPAVSRAMEDPCGDCAGAGEDCFTCEQAPVMSCCVEPEACCGDEAAVEECCCNEAPVAECCCNAEPAEGCCCEAAAPEACSEDDEPKVPCNDCK